MSRARRIGAGAAAALVGAAVLLVATAPTASAHNVSGVSSSNYETTLDGVSPDTPGITVMVVEAGSRLQLTNTNDHDVIVLGYEDEPYLRVGPRGVFENQRSPATYLNRNRTGTQVPPDSADPEAEPDWKKIADGHTARWHDHRIHWMGADVPRPNHRFVVEDQWVVPLKYQGERLEVTGQLLWVPGPSPLPWFTLAIGLVALCAFIGLRSWWGKGLAVVLAVLIVTDVVHLLGILGATAGGPNFGAVGANLIYSAVSWSVGAAGVVLLARGKRDGLFAAIFAGVLLAVFGGLQDLGVLSHSQIPFAWSGTSARLLVTLTLGLGVGVTVGAVLALWRQGAFSGVSLAKPATRPSGAADPR